MEIKPEIEANLRQMDRRDFCRRTGCAQGASAPDLIKACGSLVRHTHVKDVKSAGKHETCLLGEGIVNVAECLKTLRQLNYKGWYSWEDEPEDRNPFDSAKRNRQWLEQHLA